MSSLQNARASINLQPSVTAATKADVEEVPFDVLTTTVTNSRGKGADGALKKNWEIEKGQERAPTNSVKVYLVVFPMQIEATASRPNTSGRR